METGRSHLGAAAVGNEIIVAGGSGLLGPRNDFESYDVAYDYWRPLPSMPEAREQFAMVSLGSEVHVIGGFGTDGRRAPSAEVWTYIATVSSWRQGPDMPIALARHAAVALGGTVYVFGGVDAAGDPNDRIFVLSGVGAGWRELDRRMPEPLADMDAAVLDGQIYVVGGRRANGNATSRMDVFDPETESWTPAAALPQARADHVAGAVGGRIHVAGGIYSNVFHTYQDHFAYDPVSNRWRTVEPLRTPRHSLAAVVVGDEWYIVGGGAGAGLFTEFTEADVLEVYDPAPSE